MVAERCERLHVPGTPTTPCLLVGGAAPQRALWRALAQSSLLPIITAVSTAAILADRRRLSSGELTARSNTSLERTTATARASVARSVGRRGSSSATVGGTFSLIPSSKYAYDDGGAHRAQPRAAPQTQAHSTQDHHQGGAQQACLVQGYE